MNPGPKHPGAARRALHLLVAVGLCHVPVWLIGRFSVMPQPLFSLDVILALGLFTLNRSAGTGAMLLAWALSLLRGIALNYHFHDVSEFIDSFRFAQLLSFSSFVNASSLAVALLMVGIGFVIFRLVSTVKPRFSAVIVLAVALAGADIVNGSASAIGLGRDVTWTSVNLLGTPGYNLARTELTFQRFGAQPLVALDPPPRSWAELSEHARRGKGSSVLILVESLGWPRDEEVRRWLFAQLETPSLRERWELDVDRESFYGGTVGGEVRVLCGLRGHYSKLDARNSAGCLPWVAREQGIGTTAMHGFSARMFDRGEWWFAVGFDRADFDTSFIARDSPLCPGAFNGVCDHDVLAAAFARALEGRQFVYALTINTHLPLPSTRVTPPLAAMCVRHGIPEAGCELVEAQARLLRDIGEQVAALSHGVDLVMVVGDHSPPFYAGVAREAFSDSVVPSLRLRLRSSSVSQ